MWRRSTDTMGRSRQRGSGGGRTLSRRSALALIAGGGLLSIGGVGAYNVVEGGRPFDIGVTAPDDAVLSFNILDDIEANHGETVDLIELTNHYDIELSVENVDIIDGSEISVTINPSHQPTLSGGGGTGSLEGIVRCSGASQPVTETVQLSVTAQDSYPHPTQVIVTQEALEVPITCYPPVDPPDLYKDCETSLIAGQHYDIGTVRVVGDPEDDEVRITYEVDDGWSILKTHAAIGADLDHFQSSDWVTPGWWDNPIPGQFPWSTDEDADGSQEVTITVDSDEVESVGDVEFSEDDEWMIATHADVVADDGSEEGAWGEGPEFNTPRASWGMYFHCE